MCAPLSKLQQVALDTSHADQFSCSQIQCWCYLVRTMEAERVVRKPQLLSHDTAHFLHLQHHSHIAITKPFDHVLQLPVTSVPCHNQFSYVSNYL